MNKIKIPFIIGGETINREENTEKIDFHKKSVEISTPVLTPEDLEKIKKTQEYKKSLHDLNSEEIISFLTKAKEKWKKGSNLREEAGKKITQATGYSPEMVDFALQQIEDILSRDYLELLLKSELGNKEMMDSWVEKGEAYVHCQPAGTVLHILSGNAPLIGIISLLRGLLTKNINILKMSSGDLVTLSHFIQIFQEIDPDHPITKSISAVYWKSSGLETLNQFVEISDLLCVWGGGEAVETIKNNSQGKEVLEFGPRRGVQLIGKEVFQNKNPEYLKGVARKGAHDLVVFDQEACFSPQVCFIEGNWEEAKKYASELKKGLEEENSRLPKGEKNLQSVAAVEHLKAYSTFLGNEILDSPQKDHMIVITEKVKHTKSHPLGRTLFIIPVEDFSEAIKEIGEETQVVAIEPFSRAYELREELTLNGVDRITHLGKMPYFAAGAPHEGIYPLSRMVRWVKSR